MKPKKPLSDNTEEKQCRLRPLEARPKRQSADSDEAGHAFQYEAGRPFRSEAGQHSDLMSATDCLLSQIEVDDVSDVVGGQASADFRRSDEAFAGCLRLDRCDRRCG